MLKQFASSSKESRFTDLVQAVHQCSLCDRLCERRKVFSNANGSINSNVLFVAEAPGRLGADRTGIPLFGDKTGDNFDHLLGNIGWHRDEIFVTNAVLCNPREKNDLNDTPTADEIENCMTYLRMIIELIQPLVVVSLGAVALKSLAKIHPHNANLKEDVGKPLPWFGRALVPLYHPGPRAVIHRSTHNQRADFMNLAKIIHPIQGLVHKKASTGNSKATEFDAQMTTIFQHLVLCIIQSLGRISYFKLTKLLYLVELKSIQKFGRGASQEIFLRQPEGPWPPALKKQIPSLLGREAVITHVRDLPFIEPGPSPRFMVDLDESVLDLVVEVVSKYGHMTNSEVKTAVYSTSPMLYLLREEKKGRDMRRVPVVYKNQTSIELDIKGKD